MNIITLPKDKRGFVIIGKKETIRLDFLVSAIENKKIGRLLKDERHNVTFELNVNNQDFKSWLLGNRMW